VKLDRLAGGFMLVVVYMGMLMVMRMGMIVIMDVGMLPVRVLVHVFMMEIPGSLRPGNQR
jgi:hypothetical protein